MRGFPRACVIGAGSSGIAATKALHARGLDVDCFERSDRVGGLWAFREGAEKTAAYRSLHINTSRDRMQYSDFPMPRDYPHFPHHAQVAAYFEAYVDHFGFRDRIRFGTAVEHVARRDDGVWTVRLDGGEEREYDAVLVANGHHWDPRWPDPPFPGGFDGLQLHSHDYVDAEPLRGRRVVVLGMGNSAMDIAVESSLVAERTFLAARRGAHVIPKFAMGRPADANPILTNPHVPWRIRRRIGEVMLRLTTGDITRLGMPKPDHRILDAHPTISDSILSRVSHGDVIPKPAIAELCGDGVRFTDGSVERADVIVYATGYRISFPFFDEGFISAPGNDLPLFRRVFHPRIGGVYFIALLQPLGATMPLAEAQSEWVADHLMGRYHLPPLHAVLADIEREREALFRRYVASPRHTMEVDFDDYLLALRRERRRGFERARRAGFTLQVPPRAVAEPVAA